MKKIIIGILSRIELSKHGGVIGYEKNYVSSESIEIIMKVGGIPIIIPVVNDINILEEYISNIDGLLVPGGGDINPLIFDEEPILKQGFVYKEVDDFDIATIKLAYAKQIPILGICRGIQIINVAFGGTIYQDLSQFTGNYINHFQKAKRDFQYHTVNISSDSILFKLLGEKIITNSFHHQAVNILAKGFRISAKTKDNIIEAIEKVDDSFILGIQWHPEMMYKTNEKMLKIVELFFLEALKKSTV